MQYWEKPLLKFFLIHSGKIYTSQDLQVIRRGKKLTEQLELHLYAKKSVGLVFNL